MAKQSAKDKKRNDLSQIRYLFAFLTKDKRAFLIARRRLDSRAFSREHEGYKIVWEQTVLFYNRWNKLPKTKELKSAILSYLDETGMDDEVAEIAIEEVLELCPTLTPDIRDERRDAVLTSLRVFLDASVSREIASRLSEGEDAGKAFNLGKSQLVQNASVEQGTSKNWFASLENAAKEARIIVYPTGNVLADELTNGGLRSGEVMLHMGAVNSGKTSFAVDVAVSRAKYEYRLAKKQNRKNGKVFFYVYEESRQVFSQILARAADVHTSSIQEFLESQDKTVLSTREKGNYKAYEKRWRQLGAKKLDGEWERLNKAMALMEECLFFVSMSSEDEGNLVYSGDYVDGLVEHYELQLELQQHKPDLIVIDHASAMVERHMHEHGLKDEKRRHLLKALAMQLRDRLAAPYRIPIYTLHQLSGEENKRPPGTVPDVTSGAECRMMHEFFSFAIQSSRLTEPDKIGVVALGKKRRMKGADSIPFMLDGDLVRWRDARSSHIIHNGRVRSKEDVSPVRGTQAAAFTPRRNV